MNDRFELEQVLHLYAQKEPHSTARIIGSKDQLIKLRDLLDHCIKHGPTAGCFFTTDGEEYTLTIKEDVPKSLPYTSPYVTSCQHPNAFYYGDTSPPIYKCDDCGIVFIKS